MLPVREIVIFMSVWDLYGILPMKMKKVLENQGLFLAEKERSSSRSAASHCCRYRLVLRLFARTLRRLPLLTLPFSATGGGRVRPSRGRSISNLFPNRQQKKHTIGVLFFGGEGALHLMYTTSLLCRRQADFPSIIQCFLFIQNLRHYRRRQFRAASPLL